MKRDALPRSAPDHGEPARAPGHGPAGSAEAPRCATAEPAWQGLRAAASAPYRTAGRFAWHFARGKLGRDPAFKSLIAHGELPQFARVVDIGCGQGLMASLLQSCADAHTAGRWPAAWPPPPQAESYHGIELMPRDVQRARAATAGLALAPSFECNDMRRAVLPPCELVVILDVLHYVDHAAQSALLARVRDALLQGRVQRGAAPAAAAEAAARAQARRLLLRVGDAASARGFAMSQWVDRVVTLARGHRVPPTWGRPLAGWVALLEELGFRVRSVPMSQGTPFANVLLVADVIGQA